MLSFPSQQCQGSPVSPIPSPQNNKWAAVSYRHEADLPTAASHLRVTGDCSAPLLSPHQ